MRTSNSSRHPAAVFSQIENDLSSQSTMPKTYYCWKCRHDIPMLTDAEWQIIEPMVRTDIEIIKEYRTATNCTLGEALDRLPFDSSEQVFQWSGYRERSPSNFYHHRLSEWGPECGQCGHLLRTPEASFCANCGAIPEHLRESNRSAERIMRLLNLLAPILFAISAQAGDLSKLVLPGKNFGPDWELTQPNLLESAAAPNYINRKLPHQPVVMVNIIDFMSPEAARAQWGKKFGDPKAAAFVKKVEDLPDAYDYLPPAHMKRFMLIGRYWLTVEQVGDKDDRTVFMEKYYKHIKTIADQTVASNPTLPSPLKSKSTVPGSED